MKGHPVFVAQHATATCCRECIRKWHKNTTGKRVKPDTTGIFGGCDNDVD